MSRERGAAVVKTEGGWVVDFETPIFIAARDYLRSRIPRYETEETKDA